MRRLSELSLRDRIATICVLIVGVLVLGEFVLLALQRDGGSVSAARGSVLNSLSVEKLRTGSQTGLTISVRVTNTTSDLVLHGRATLSFTSQNRDIGDALVTNFDLEAGASKVLSWNWFPPTPAIRDCTVTAAVNEGQDIDLGNATTFVNLS